MKSGSDSGCCFDELKLKNFGIYHEDAYLFGTSQVSVFSSLDKKSDNRPQIVCLVDTGERFLSNQEERGKYLNEIFAQPPKRNVIIIYFVNCHLIQKNIYMVDYPPPPPLITSIIFENEKRSYLMGLYHHVLANIPWGENSVG